MDEFEEAYENLTDYDELISWSEDILKAYKALLAENKELKEKLK